MYFLLLCFHRRRPKRFHLSVGTHCVQVAGVIAACEKAVPRHGEQWCAIAKQTANRHKPIAEILHLVAETIPLP